MEKHSKYAVLILVIIILGCSGNIKKGYVALSGKFIDVSETEYDLGYVPQGYVVTIKNTTLYSIGIGIDSYDKKCIKNIYLTKSYVKGEDETYLIVDFKDDYRRYLEETSITLTAFVENMPKDSIRITIPIVMKRNL